MRNRYHYTRKNAKKKEKEKKKKEREILKLSKANSEIKQKIK